MRGLTTLVVTEQEAFEQFLQSRTEDSFTLLCELLSPRLIRYFRARSCDPVTTEELTQDVLLAVYRRGGTVRDPGVFQAWVYRVAHNALLQRVRSASRRVQTVSERDMAGGRWEQLATAAPHSGDLDMAFAALNEQDRDILLLRFVDGLDYQEIAAMLGIPVGTAKWRVFNSKMKLAAQVRKGVGR